MRATAVAAVVLALAACATPAKQQAPAPSEYEPRDVREPGGRINWFWFDDLEPADSGWTHGDFATSFGCHFHIDAYMAYAGQYSWWCGTFDYDADGGYGNYWHDWLDLPPVEPATSVERTSWGSIKAKYRESPSEARREGGRDPLYPVLTFAYRNDTEPGYDFTFVQAESSGAFVHLNRGFDGVHPWGTAGYHLLNKDVPYTIRFRFVSDGAWSDEDGLYLSNGGAFMCDDIRVWDYYTGDTYFFEDVESGGQCTPGGPWCPQDFWHVIDNPCKAFSDPHVWVNTEVDTPGFVPANVMNWLRTPVVDVSNAVACTTYFVIQYFTPTVDNDYWTETVCINGVWTQLHAWWGDQCHSGYGPCDHFPGGDSVTALLPGGSMQMFHQWVYYSTDDGAGPDNCGCAGITLDDIGFYGAEEITTVKEMSWGRVKALYP